MGAVAGVETGPVTARTHPRLAPRRGGTARSWWARALLASTEEAAYSEAELRRGRALARGGHVGAVTVDGGRVVAAVLDGDDAWTVTVEVPELDADAAQALVEVVAAGSGWLGALLAGSVPDAFLEGLDESGVEVVPYAGDLTTRCGCEAWADPCPHALAVLTQLAWLVDADPFVLTHLRGLPREEVLGRLAELRGVTDDEPDEDLAVALEAAERAERILAAMASGDADVRRWL